MRVFGHKAPVTAVIGLAIIAFTLLIVVFGPWIAPYGEAESFGKSFQPISPEHWLGTDKGAKDILTRLLYGTRLTVVLALVITLLSFAIGIVLGLLAAVLGRW